MYTGCSVQFDRRYIYPPIFVIAAYVTNEGLGWERPLIPSTRMITESISSGRIKWNRPCKIVKDLTRLSLYVHVSPIKVSLYVQTPLNCRHLIWGLIKRTSPRRGQDSPVGGGSPSASGYSGSNREPRPWSPYAILPANIINVCSIAG